MNVILKTCKESDKVSRLAISWQLRQHATILDGRPLHNDPGSSFDENLRTRRFSTFCRDIVAALIWLKMLTQVEDVVDNLGNPLEVVYIRTTGLGSVFMRLPSMLQRVAIFSIDRAVGCMLTIKKYRWVATVISVLTAAFHWTEAHNLTHMTIYVSLLVGLASALIFGWFASLFDTQPLQSDDDSIG